MYLLGAPVIAYRFNIFFFTTIIANITLYLAICLLFKSNNVIFTLKTINPNYNKEKVT